MIVFLIQCCVLLILAIILVFVLLCVNDLRFGSRAHKELRQFRDQLRYEIHEDIRELLQENLDEGDGWKR